MDPADAEVWELGLVLRRELGHHSSSCQTIQGPADVRLERGASIKSPGALDVVYTDPSGTPTAPVTLPADAIQPFLVAYAGPLDLRVTSPAHGGQIVICDQAGAPVNIAKTTLGP